MQVFMKEEKTVFYPYSSWLKQRYGEKVYKLPVNLPVSCPNRCDGHGGCTFCSEKGTGFESVWQPASVTEQMQHARDVVAKRYKARKFIAYFQNYTNTFMAMELFKAYLEEAAAFPDVVEISVSTWHSSKAHTDECRKRPMNTHRFSCSHSHIHLSSHSPCQT